MNGVWGSPKRGEQGFGRKRNRRINAQEFLDGQDKRVGRERGLDRIERARGVIRNVREGARVI